MTSVIDIHTNILENKSNISNPRIVELFKKIKPTTIKKKKIIKNKTVEINKKANFPSLLNSMKVNKIRHSVCFSYQWKNQSDCLRANDFILKKIEENKYSNISALVVLQPKAKKANYFLEKYLNNINILGMKIKPSWCNVSLSNTKYLGPLCETLIFKNKFLLTHISQGFHPNMGDNLYELTHLLKNFPKLKVVAAHMGGGAIFYENYKPMTKLYKNLYFDISLPSQLEWLPLFLNKVNHRKFLYASDFPYFSQKKLLDILKKSKIPKSKFNDLVFFNAKNLINSCSKNNIIS